MSRPLTGGVAIVTGASSGIGRATAIALAEAGAAVALAARRGDRLDELVARIQQSGGGALAVPTDVADRAAVFALVERAAAEFGPADILVNNAGIMPTSPLSQLHLDDWLRMVDVNVKGVLHCVAAALPAMLERRRGHIVNVGSLAGRRPFPGGTVYGATKFAVRCLSAGIQLELSARHGIRVTDVQPGVVATELMDHIPDPETRQGFAEGWRDKQPMGPEDVAAAILYAVSAPAHVNVNEILMRPARSGDIAAGMPDTAVAGSGGDALQQQEGEREHELVLDVAQDLVARLDDHVVRAHARDGVVPAHARRVLERVGLDALQVPPAAHIAEERNGQKRKRNERVDVRLPIYSRS